MNTPAELLKELWEPPSDEHATKWISEKVELPPDSELKQFDFELFPLARFALDQLCHNEFLRRFTEMLSSQVGKTVTILAYLCWKIINRPSGVGWYTDTGINAKGDYKTKIIPALESCEPVAKLLPSDRAKKNNTLIQFGFMNLRVMGAESSSNREGKTITEVLCDEVRNYPPGAMQQIDNRFKTITNYRRILFSSAGDMHQEPWPSFKKGTMHLGFWPCPKCGHKQTFRFGRDESPLYPERRTAGGFIWSTNTTTHPAEDVYNFAELIKTIRYQCENLSCKHEFPESEKLKIIRVVEFRQTNPMADPADVSVHCWEAYMPFSGCSWGSIVMKYLNAVVAMKHGNIEPMKVFRKETEGEPWEERGVKVLEGEILNRCGDYSTGEEKPDWKKQITVDVQLGYLHYNLSQFDPLTGDKRLIERGKILDFDELRMLQTKKGVRDHAVAIDCAHTPAKVFEACSKYGKWRVVPAGKHPACIQRTIRGQSGNLMEWDGWVALLGHDATEFTISLGGATTRTHAKPHAIDSNIGKAGGARHVLRVTWSNPHYREELFLRRIKGIGRGFEIPKNIDADYVKQMQSTERIELRDAAGTVTGHEWKERGRHDDSDCEQMQLVLADINGVTK